MSSGDGRCLIESVVSVFTQGIIKTEQRSIVDVYHKVHDTIFIYKDSVSNAEADLDDNLVQISL